MKTFERHLMVMHLLPEGNSWNFCFWIKFLRG